MQTCCYCGEPATYGNDEGLYYCNEHAAPPNTICKDAPTRSLICDACGEKFKHLYKQAERWLCFHCIDE